MKNNIKKASVKFWEDLLYFQNFMQIFVFAPISDYHHLKQCTDAPKRTKTCKGTLGAEGS